MNDLQVKWIGCHATNFRQGRRAGRQPIAIVIHVMLGTLYGTDGHFQSMRRGSESSAHYGIGTSWEDFSRNTSHDLVPGRVSIHQYVREQDTAFHVGVRKSNWPNPNRHTAWTECPDNTDPNDITIGIEHQGKYATVWTDALYDASASLCADIANRWNIPIDRQHIIGHYEVDPKGKPLCPGMCDLDRLVRQIKERNSHDGL